MSWLRRSHRLLLSVRSPVHSCFSENANAVSLSVGNLWKQSTKNTILGSYYRVHVEPRVSVLPILTRRTKSSISRPISSKWHCDVCKAVNEARTSTCHVCDAERLFSGDWFCAECSHHNRSYTKKCGHCNAQKSESPNCFSCSYAKPDALFNGTWRCTLRTGGCGHVNSVTHEECQGVGCGKLAEPDVAVWIPWYCQSCHAYNPSTRKTCYYCGYPSQWLKQGGVLRTLPDEAEGGSLATARWECLECTYPNSAHTNFCHQCNAMKHSEGQWSCRSCGSKNHAFREYCCDCGGK
eukprot:CFRG3034T1